MQRIITPWLVYTLTGSELLLGVVGFAGQIPTFIIAPFAGVLLDRFDRKKLLIFTQILSMMQSFLIAYLFFSKTLEVWHIVSLSVFLGIVNAFDMPGRQSFVVDLIDNRQDLGNAIALNSSVFNAARLIGPAVAGLIIAATGEGVCFLLKILCTAAPIPLAF